MNDLFTEDLTKLRRQLSSIEADREELKERIKELELATKTDWIGIAETSIASDIRQNLDVLRGTAGLCPSGVHVHMEKVDPRGAITAHSEYILQKVTLEFP